MFSFAVKVALNPTSEVQKRYPGVCTFRYGSKLFVAVSHQCLKGDVQVYPWLLPKTLFTLYVSVQVPFVT